MSIENFKISLLLINRRNYSKTKAPSSKRDVWANDIEFLMSCISLSVGLGNVWRFPFTVLDNGGGAFLLPCKFEFAFENLPVREN